MEFFLEHAWGKERIFWANTIERILFLFLVIFWAKSISIFVDFVWKYDNDVPPASIPLLRRPEGLGIHRSHPYISFSLGLAKFLLECSFIFKNVSLSVASEHPVSSSHILHQSVTMPFIIRSIVLVQLCSDCMRLKPCLFSWKVEIAGGNFWQR